MSDSDRSNRLAMFEAPAASPGPVKTWIQWDAYDAKGEHIATETGNVTDRDDMIAKAKAMKRRHKAAGCNLVTCDDDGATVAEV